MTSLVSSSGTWYNIVIMQAYQTITEDDCLHAHLYT